MSKKILSLTIRFRAIGDTTIPPFSAKVSKLIMHRLSSLYKYSTSSNSPFKPVAITPLIHEGKALIKTHEEGKLRLKDGELYSFRSTIIVDEDIEMGSLIDVEQQRVDGVFNSSILLDSLIVEVKDFDSLTLGKPKGVKVRFISPVLLQLPSYNRLSTGRHILFPLPSLMIRSLLDHWNANYGPEYIIRSRYVQIYSNYAMVESDFYIKPITAYYDDVRRPRGFVGWVIYEIKARRKRNAYSNLMRLLDYARYVGIGRSRATGFGQVS